MKPFLHLNFNQPVLSDTFVLPPAEEPDKGYWHYYRKISVNETIHPSLLVRLLKLDLCYRPTCLLFYAPPGARLKIHKDSDDPNAWAINWSLTPNLAEMVWYTTQSEGEQKLVYPSTTPTPFTSYQGHDVTEICREEIRHPTIVKIGIPHGGYNHSNQGAWLLSLRFMYPVTWQQATTTLAPFVEV